MFVIIGATGGYCGHLQNSVIFSTNIKDLQTFDTVEEAEKIIKELDLNCEVMQIATQ